MFHPKEDLIVSASLDQTVRVWDIGGPARCSRGCGPEDMLRLPRVKTKQSGVASCMWRAVSKGGGDLISYNMHYFC